MAETASKTVKQRYQEASYLKVGENFELMGTGFTELNEDPGAQTTSKKYINDKSSTSSITSYEGEHGFTADQIPSENVIKDLVSIGKERKTGADAEREFVRVDLDEKVEGDTTGTVFKARMFTVAALIMTENYRLREHFTTKEILLWVNLIQRQRHLHRIQQRSKRKRSLKLELRSKIYVYLEWKEARI